MGIKKPAAPELIPVQRMLWSVADPQLKEMEEDKN